MYKWIVAAAATCLAVSPASAQQPAQQQQQQVTSSGGFVMARSLYASCISQDASQQLSCRTYLMGIADGMAMHKDNRWAPPVLCNATQLQIAQLSAIYVDYIRRNPQMSSWTAASTAYNALAERFPCPAQG